MARNVEIKARLRDPAAAHETAAHLSGGPPRRIEQRDVFFRCPNGRLKLRHFGESRGELIHYERKDTADARTSEYVVVPTDCPAALEAALERAFGILGVVEKTRFLYLAGRTRIHIDEVRGLGNFLEFEAVLAPGETGVEGREEVAALMREFGLAAEDLVPCAYVDLMAGNG